MGKIIEKTALRGIFRLKVFRSGRLVEEIEEENLIVAGAGEQLAHLLAGDVKGRSISKIAFGTNGNNAHMSDTAITNQWSKLIAGYSYNGDGEVTFNWDLGVTENNGMAIIEFGLLTVDGTLFARRVRIKPIHKESDVSIEGQWKIIFNRGNGYGI